MGMLVGCGSDLGVLHPDTILLNGKMVTVDEDFSIAEAVAIKDGKFIAVGSNTEVRGLAGDRTEVIDLEGATVLPGFNDPHLHFAHSLGFVADELTKKFRTSKSIKEILAVVGGPEKGVGDAGNGGCRRRARRRPVREAVRVAGAFLGCGTLRG